jgi:hypothetical protein
MDLTRDTDPTKYYMGIDWGDTTVYLVLDENDNIINADKINTKKFDEVAVLTGAIKRYNINVAVGDQGYGARQLKELQSIFGKRVQRCYYVSNPDNPYKYKRKDEEGNKVYMHKVDRTTSIEDTIDLFDKLQLGIPYDDENWSLEWMFDEFMAIKSTADELEADEISPTAGSKRVRYGRTSGDHAFHALNYARIAKRKKQGSSVVVLGGN